MDLLEGVREDYDVDFTMKVVTADKQIHNLANKVRSTGLLIDKKQKYKRRGLTEKLKRHRGQT
jgi:hypothetical protein